MLEETLRYLGIAFVSSAALIVMSKIILQHLIRRPADYYNAAEIYQEEMMLNAAGFSITEEIETNPEGELTSETIDATPQISVEEAVEMDLIELDRIPEKYIEAELSQPVIESEIAESDDITADNADIPEEGETTDDADETFADIRKQLELAYERSLAEAAESTVQADDVSKKTRKRLPSMRMRRDQLIEIAKSYEIEIPEDATKRIILGLIGEVTEIDDTQPDRSRSRGNNNGNRKSGSGRRRNNRRRSSGKRTNKNPDNNNSGDGK